MLVGARALQGVFGALLAPAALATLATTFTDPTRAVQGVRRLRRRRRRRQRRRSGARRRAHRVAVLALVPLRQPGLRRRRRRRRGRAAPQHPRRRAGPRLDIPGTLLASAACSASSSGSPTPRPTGGPTPLTLGALVAGVVLLAAFVLVQQRVADPLLPLRVVADRVRGDVATSPSGSRRSRSSAVFLFLTYYLQQVKGFSPIVTGLSFLPLTAGIVTASTTAQHRAAAALRPAAAGRRPAWPSARSACSCSRG